jgi:hypothetical protein
MVDARASWRQLPVSNKVALLSDTRIVDGPAASLKDRFCTARLAFHQWQRLSGTPPRRETRGRHGHGLTMRKLFVPVSRDAPGKQDIIGIASMLLKGYHLYYHEKRESNPCQLPILGAVDRHIPTLSRISGIKKN